MEGFVAAYGEPAVPERWRDTVRQVLRQRLAAHEHPEAVADALTVVPRSHPFGAIEDLAAIGAPAVVVASRDEADPEHPFALAQAYAEAIPGARLVAEDEGESPLAWQGGRLSGVILKPCDGELTAAAFDGDTLFVLCGDKVFARKTKSRGVGK